MLQGTGAVGSQAATCSAVGITLAIHNPGWYSALAIFLLT